MMWLIIRLSDVGKTLKISPKLSDVGISENFEEVLLMLARSVAWKDESGAKYRICDVACAIQGIYRDHDRPPGA